MTMPNSCPTKTRIRTENRSVFTSLRKILHQAERECEDLVYTPFLLDSEKENSQLVYQQILFCLSLTKEDGLS